jgi:N-acetylmuramoyl-L-alanine amidase
MERVLKYLLICGLVFILGINVVCAAPGKSANVEYRQARDAYVTLAKDVSKQQYRHNWDKALSPLKQFIAHYPAHNKTASAYYLLGKAYTELYAVTRGQSDARAATNYFMYLANNYPASTLADDALYLLAQIEADILHENERARENCSLILQKYPRGDMVANTRKLMAQLPAPVKVATPKVRPVKPNYVKASTGHQAEVVVLRHDTSDDCTRVVIELNKKAQFKVNTLAPSQLSNGLARLYIDVQGVKKNAKVLSSQLINEGIVEQIRVGENKDYTRIVCDLKELTCYKVLELQDPPRIVVDIACSKDAQLLTNVPQLQTAPPLGQQDISAFLAKMPEEQPMRVSLPDVAPKPKGKLRIVVDAGHGGKDPGAIGSSNLYEKDVALKMAKTLAGCLKSKLGCEVLLTRDRDVFIPLHQRTAYANKVDADMFISIHANASHNKNAHGIETFYLNFSKNDKAVAVAARENGMSIKEVGDLELILFDLMANSKINESSRLAADIQSSLISTLSKKYSNVKDLGVRQGPFHVLLGATMPSVLVEVAFISHKQEAKRLSSSSYRKRSAEAIASGVHHYLKSHKLL